MKRGDIARVHSSRHILPESQGPVCSVTLSLVEADPLALRRRLVLQRRLPDHEVVHKLLLLLQHHGVGVLVEAELLGNDGFGVSPEEDGGVVVRRLEVLE